MFNTNTSVFGTNSHNQVTIEECDVIFVSDLFVNEYVGGAELTTEVFFNYKKDIKIKKIKSNQVNLKDIELGINKYWIFFNYSSMNMDLIPTIVANLNYTVVEYDYKFCKYRSVEKHLEIENEICDCHDQIQGKLVSAFMYGADNLIWMSEGQKNLYVEKFPFLDTRNNFVVSSAFKDTVIKKLIDVSKQKNRNGKALIVGSSSWIKGVNDSVNYCKENNIDYDIISGLSHNDLIEKMSEYSHFVFMPKGMDTCPRILIEAKLAGLQLHYNKNCQHTTESWWTSNHETFIQYIENSGKRFWNIIDKTITRKETISGYTTTRNCIDQKYPYIQAIKSMLGFCNQVVVVDGGSTDGTWESLVELSKLDDRIIIEQKKRDWEHPRFAVFDGLQKAYARSLCAGDWCWQMDSDEIVHHEDYSKIKKIIKNIPKSMHLLALPVVEYWGGSEKVRIDVNPWKWRLSRNHKHITHGIPKQLRKIDKDGQLYSLPGSDGCDYIDGDTYEIIPCMNFYSKEVEFLRQKAVLGDFDAIQKYENWFNNVVENLPGVHHYSWYDLERKIKTYKNYWSKHWQSLYDIKQDDTAANNMFFDKKWSDVSDAEISALAKKLKDKMGGWIFHRKIDFEKPTPHIYIERGQPEEMK